MDIFEFLKNNEKQINAIKNEGNTFVLGNPGSGKTRLIVAKIMDLLNKGVNPEDILCMSFTNKAKEELSSNIIENLSSEYDIKNLRVETFHSFAYDSVKEYLQKNNVKSNLIKESLQRFLIFKVIKENNYFNYGDNYLKKIASDLSQKMSYFKSFKINEHNNKLIIDKIKSTYKLSDNKTDLELLDNIEKFLPLIPEIVAKYELEKLKYGIDYTDMLIYFNEYLDKNPIYYKYVIVDEVQDSNEIQTDIVMKLSSQGIRFAVGDLKQSIFRFQGASINSISRFRENANEYILFDNFRSTQEILDYSKTFLINKTGKYKDELKDLKTGKSFYGSKPIVINAEDPNSAVFYYINKFLNESEDKNICVIAKTNSMLEEISNILDQFNIPYSIYGKSNSLSNYIFNSVMSFIDILSNQNLTSLIPVLASPFINLSFKEINDVKEYIKINNVKTIEELKSLPELKYFFKIYVDFQQNNSYVGLTKLFSTYLLPCSIALGKSQYLTVNEMFKVLKDYYETFDLLINSDLIDYLTTSSDVYELIIGEDDARVQLYTIHSSKGKQFDSVIYMPKTTFSKLKFIEYAFDGIVLQNADICDDIESENYKLDFVAFTRAKENLVVINNKVDYFVKDYSELLDSKDNPNMEVIDIDDNSLYYRKYSEIISILESKNYDYAIEKINLLKQNKENKFDWIIEKIESYRKNRNYSFSSINLFIDCPRKFLFKYVLSIPEFFEGVDFGKTIHKKINLYYKGIKQELNDDEKLVFENLYFCESELKKKAKIDDFSIYGSEIHFEYSIKDFLDLECNGMISGDIDCIMQYNNNYYIIDFKTNKKMDADANQLHFYKYMFSETKSISLELIDTYFFYIYLRDYVINVENKPYGAVKGVLKSKFEDTIEKYKASLKAMIFDEPKIYFNCGKNKNPNSDDSYSSCQFCFYKLMCKRFEHELKELKDK